MNKADKVTGVIVIIIGVITLGLTLNFPQASRPGIPGPALLPQLIAVALVICGMMLFFTASVRKVYKNIQFNREAIKRLLGVILLTSLSAAALPLLGFLFVCLATSLVFLIILRVRLHIACITAAAITAGIYAVFHYGLQVQFPSGLMW